MHRAFGGEDRVMLFPPSAHADFSAWRGHRAIGVVYRPQYEAYGNYVPTVLPRRYDAFLFIDQTAAVRPLLAAALDLEAEDESPETYPTGV